MNHQSVILCMRQLCVLYRMKYFMFVFSLLKNKEYNAYESLWYLISLEYLMRYLKEIREFFGKWKYVSVCLLRKLLSGVPFGFFRCVYASNVAVNNSAISEVVKHSEAQTFIFTYKKVSWSFIGRIVCTDLLSTICLLSSPFAWRQSTFLLLRVLFLNCLCWLLVWHIFQNNRSQIVFGTIFDWCIIFDMKNASLSALICQKKSFSCTAIFGQEELYVEASELKRPVGNALFWLLKRWFDEFLGTELHFVRLSSKSSSLSNSERQ